MAEYLIYVYVDGTDYYARARDPARFLETLATRGFQLPDRNGGTVWIPPRRISGARVVGHITREAKAHQVTKALMPNRRAILRSGVRLGAPHK